MASQGESGHDDVPPGEIAAGVKKIRRRRAFLLSLVLAYVPAIWLVLEATGSDRKAGVVFAVWIALVAVAAGLTALSICPRCKNPFHMNGFIPIYFLRKCLHCRLPLRGKQDEE